MSTHHDTRIEVDGDIYWVRRDFDLIVRIEQASGPLADFELKLRRSAVPANELFQMFRIVLASQASRPPDDLIRQHIFEIGIVTASAQIAEVVLHLFHGNKRTIAWLEEEASKAGKGDPEGDPLKAV